MIDMFINNNNSMRLLAKLKKIHLICKLSRNVHDHFIDTSWEFYLKHYNFIIASLKEKSILRA